ncbi:MAG: enoyl-CoA hydratase, partial [Pseudomonadota bacterium]
RPITPILPRMVGEGRLGRKLSVGWYRYPGGGGLVIDPLVEDLLREEAWFLGVARFEVSEEVLADKLVLGLIDSALRLLGTSALQDIARIDRVSIDALGFPAEKGGILSYARDLGQRVLSELLSGCHATDRTLQSGLERLFSTA